MNASNQTIENILSSTENMDAAFDIFHSMSKLKSQLIPKLVEDLSVMTHEKPYSMVTDDFQGKAYEKIKFPVTKNDKFVICFEFEGSQFNCPVLGLLSTDESNNKKGNEKFDLVTSLFKASYAGSHIQSSKTWAGWHKIEPYDWNSSQPWNMIQSGEMAEIIITEVDKLYAFVQDCIKDKVED